MFRELWFEFRKIWKSRFLWGMFVVLILIDIYQITQNVHSITSISDGEKKIYEKICGEYTEEKNTWLLETLSAYEEQIKNGGYETGGQVEGTYTGYVMGDYMVLESNYEQMKEDYQYRTYAKQIAEKAKNNVERLQGTKYQFERNKYSMIYHSFAKRKITAFHYDDLVNSFFEYDFSTILEILIVVVGTLNFLDRNRRFKMLELMDTAKIAKRKYRFCQLASIFLFSGMVLATFTGIDLLLFQRGNLSIDNWLDPLYSVQGYEETLFDGSVFQFFLMWLLGRYLVLVFFGVFLFACYSVFYSETVTIALEMVIFVGSVTICLNWKWWWNPIGLLNSQEICKAHDLYNFFSIPVLYHEVISVSLLLAILVCGSVGVMFENRKRIFER